MAKQYNSRFSLTPMPAVGKWRKKYRGKTYYVGHCSSKHDREGYKAAWAEWMKKKAELDGQPTDGELRRYEAIQQGQQAVSDWAAAIPASLLDRIQAEQVQDASLVEKVEGRKSKKGTIGGQIEAFVKLKKTRYALGELSALRVQTVGQHLKHFEAFAGKDTSAKRIDEDMVVAYHGHLIQGINRGEFNKTTAHDRWAAFKEWVGQIYSIPTPKNLLSKDLSIKVAEREVNPFTLAEVKTLLTAPNERFQLWVLLALNAGMTQGDISNIIPEEVDWQAGVITRKRSKTKNVASVPVVRYKLWERTFALLKKYGKESGKRVFVNRKGKPLVQRDYKADEGKLKNQDSIYDIYRLLFPDNRKPFKTLRKTGATLLANHKDHRWYVGYYLGHSPKGMAEKHYYRNDDEGFYEALAWLGEALGVG